MRSRPTKFLLVTGLASLFAGCGPVNITDLLGQLDKGGSGGGSGGDTGMDPGMKDPPPKPEPPRCEPTRVPPPPPGPAEEACPSLKDKCADGTPIFCILDGRRAVLGCGDDGFRRVLAIDGEIKCEDPTPPKPECKPIPKPDCKDPVFDDRDGDGCIDSITCAGPVTPPPPPKPECKPLPKVECKDPVYEDRDGDGCIDLFTCRDNVPTPPTVGCDVPPPPADYKVDVCPDAGSLCMQGSFLWCTAKDSLAIMTCNGDVWGFKAIQGVCY